MAIGSVEKIWLALIGLTFAGALLGETGEAGWILTLTVIVLIAVKGGIVIDYYMELRDASQRMRNIMRLFVILVSIMVITNFLWGEQFRQLTTI
jgi:heme/copper-type cytochrome/quinol oxidase subunit 4